MAATLKAIARQRGISFRQALNQAVQARLGVRARPAGPSSRTQIRSAFALAICLYLVGVCISGEVAGDPATIDVAASGAGWVVTRRQRAGTMRIPASQAK